MHDIVHELKIKDLKFWTWYELVAVKITSKEAFNLIACIVTLLLLYLVFLVLTLEIFVNIC